MILKNKTRKKTNKKLKKIESEIKKTYKRRTKNIYKNLILYIQKYEKEDKERLKKVQEGKIKMSDYQSWKVSILNTKECKKIIREIASELTKVNGEVLDYVNSNMEDVFIMNYNGTLEEIGEFVNGK